MAGTFEVASSGAVRGRREVCLARREDWRRRIRWELGWILLAKLAALTLLWALFFAPSHRMAVDARALGRQLAVTPAAYPPTLQQKTSKKEISRD